MFMAKMQDSRGLERPLGRFTQIPVQFCKLLAKVVVSVGSSRMLGGAETSRMILLRLGLAIAAFVAMMLFRVERLESFGIGRRWSVMTIFEPPMVRDFFRSMHSSINAESRMSAAELWVEKANPMMCDFKSEM